MVFEGVLLQTPLFFTSFRNKAKQCLECGRDCCKSEPKGILNVSDSLLKAHIFQHSGGLGGSIDFRC